MNAGSASMAGHLRVVCEADSSGRTFLGQQSFRAPMHLSKPYWDGAYLLINAVNSTAGLFAGDTVDVSVRVRSGTNAVFTTPSASRVFRPCDGRGLASVKQEFLVESGGWLDVCPEILIPHACSKYVQQTRIEVGSSGELLFLDSVAPGRVASNEIFAFERLEFRTELLVSGRLLALERSLLLPENGGPRALRTFHAHSYSASGFVVSPRLSNARGLTRRIAELSGPTVISGASHLRAGAIAFKLLAADSVSLRSAVSALRELCYATADRKHPSLRKL